MPEQNQNDPYAAAKRATSIGPSSKYEQWIADHPTIAKIANMFAPVDPNENWGPADVLMSILPVTGMFGRGENLASKGLSNLSNLESQSSSGILKSLSPDREAVLDRLEMLTRPYRDPEFNALSSFEGARYKSDPAYSNPIAPLSEDLRQARARDQGYIHDMYHGTESPADFREFRDIPHDEADFGIHVTPRPKTANKAIGFSEEYSGKRSLGRVLPLKVRMNKTLEVPDMNAFRSPTYWKDKLDAGMRQMRLFPENSIDSNYDDFVELYNLAHKYDQGIGQNVSYLQNSANFQRELKSKLQKMGYDSLKYKNFIEGAGEHSYLLLDPMQVKSRFAAFDPAKFGKTKDILAGLGGLAAAKKAGLITTDERSK